MKIRFLTLSLILLVAVSCNKPVDSKINTTQLTQEVNILLDDWHKAAAEANYSNYFTAMDSVSVFVGTDAAEIWSKQQFENFSKPYFDKGKAWSFTTIDRNIYIDERGEFVWFDELLDTWMGVCRGSGVVQKKNSNWKIKHYVLSVTVPNDDVRELIKIKQEKDSIFLLKYKN
ncbi:nuclear transport factor 2 family protein [Tenacibaculum sp. IB213877]|uniref:nuclear transport factor 2 family protein n=1 Tax=Tenacibaculum sp. IB213877 TaxID=3097351 RepID=UPI002A5A111A|nr:nuclear transport factor 2 family protein [Tenacibaculum sp. IB213877]MDY0780953.1 nuclear transport factor 2 family protein [Tenacibaculum sp. IB213877]